MGVRLDASAGGVACGTIVLLVSMGLALGCSGEVSAEGAAKMGSPEDKGGGSGRPSKTGAPLVDGAPVLLFSDLDSSPEGAFVTVWGRNFGASAGSVRVGGGAAEVLSWAPSRIEFRVPGGAGDGIEVTVGDLDSNKLPFTTRNQGRIFFVSQADGNNSFDGRSASAGGGGGPWQDLTAVLDRVGPGDVVYVRNGVYDEGPDLNTNWGTVLRIRGNGPSGQEGLPIAVLAYPGESPSVGHPDARRAILIDRGLSDWTIAKLTLVARSAAFHAQGVDRVRFVGNTASNVPSVYGTVGVGGNHGLRVLGNHIFDSGTEGNKLSHLVYYGGNGEGSDVEVAWNLLHDQRGGRCIQFYGHGASDRLTGLSIHDNHIFNCPYDAILVGGSDEAPPSGGWLHDAAIYNNVAYGARGAGIRSNGPLIEAFIAHNTLYGNGSAIHLQRVGTAEIVNNLSVQVDGGQYLRNEVPSSSLDMHHNGYSGLDGTPAPDAQPIEGAASFENAQSGDFRLASDSTFGAAGATLEPPLPQVSVPLDRLDLGAHGQVQAMRNSWP